MPADPWRSRCLVSGIYVLILAMRCLAPDQPILENYVGRQVPTAMVARNLARGSGFLAPQLDTGPFPNLFLVEPPIYAQVVAWTAAGVGGRVEVVGRVVSAVATTMAAWGLFGILRGRMGWRAAVGGLVAFGAFPATIRYGRAVQPDVLAMGLVLAGCRCLEGSRGVVRGLGWALVASGVAQKVYWVAALFPFVLESTPGDRRQRWRCLALASLPCLAWYGYASSFLLRGPSAAPSWSDNAANWADRLSPASFADLSRLARVARDFFVRSFTPMAPVLAVVGLASGGVGPTFRRWMISSGIALVVLYGKLHHDYYWLLLAPPMAGWVAAGLSRIEARSSAVAASCLVALAALGLVQSRSTWKTPGEWADATALARSIRDHVPAGSLLIAPEALIYLGERRGCRLEYEAGAVRRSANEWRPAVPFVEGDPFRLVEFFRREAGARYFADLARPDDPARRRLHDDLKNDPSAWVVDERPGHYLLVAFDDPQPLEGVAMPTPKPTGPVSLADFARWKAEGRKIAMLTAYDHTMAKLLDAAGVDTLLVGDSLGTVVQGWETTLKVTLAQMVYHAEMVARGARRAFVVADLPFLSYQVSVGRAVRNAGLLLKKTDCKAVKLEGGVGMAPTIRAVVEAGIPVVGHIGLTPQSVRRIGYKVQRDEDRLLRDAEAVAEAGAFAVVLECIPSEVAARVTKAIPIPTIGIGAGVGCDGQVLVSSDMLGLFQEFRPKFVRRYAGLAETVAGAVAAYVEDVRSGRFPGETESFR